MNFLAGLLHLSILALAPLLLWILPRRPFSFQAWIAVAGAGFAFLGLNLMGPHKDDFPPLGVYLPAWVLIAGIVLAFQALYFRRFFSPAAISRCEEAHEIQRAKREEAYRLEREIAELKSELIAQEAKLQESVRFYSIVRDLAECVDFEQMKRVLERDIKKAMPYLSGFVLLIVNDTKKHFEPQIQHKLWPSDDWTETGFLSSTTLQNQSAFFHKDASGRELLVAPIKSGASLLGFFIGAVEIRSAPAHNTSRREEMLIYAGTLADELKFGLLKAISFSRMEQLSRYDGLTGIFRRGVFDTRLEEEFLRAKTFKTTLGLLFLDVDHFKSINDTWGHQFGDAVLKKMAAIISGSLYETDLVARYGGEEFAVLLPRTHEEGALKKAEIIRQKVEREVFLREDKKTEVRVTISIGLAFFPRDAAASQTLLKAADEALYHSKETGRNRVTNRAEMPSL